MTEVAKQIQKQIHDLLATANISLDREDYLEVLNSVSLDVIEREFELAKETQ